MGFTPGSDPNAGAGGATTITGTVSISGSVGGVNQGLASSVAWPVFTSQAVSGIMSVSGAVSGVMSVSGAVSGIVSVSGAISGVQSISGTVTVGGSITANQGTASAVAWPVFTSQAVSGVMSISGAVSGVQSISGTVTVGGNITAAQGAASSVAWPFFTSQAVSGVFSVSGAALVTGLVSVSGNVGVSGLVTVSGAIAANQGAASAAAHWLNANGAVSSVCCATNYYNSTLSNIVLNINAATSIVYGYSVYNLNSTVAGFVQLFAVSAASTTLSSTVPKYVIPVPSGTAQNVMFPVPLVFSTALAGAATVSASGSTANVSPLLITVLYK